MIAASKLRRIVLHRQGLMTRQPFGRGLPGTRRAIQHLGYVQIDTISVVNRAHDHVLQVRVPGYQAAFLDRLVARGDIFEYWAHAAAYLPMTDYRFALPRMLAMRERRERWVRSHDDALMARVLDRVRAEGPLQARDFDHHEDGRSGGWWEWKPAKRALEQLFMQGDLMTTGRVGFQKVYDLTERVLPAWVDTRPPTLDEYAEHLLQRQLSAQGFATVSACTYQRPTPGLRHAVADALAAHAREGRLTALPRNGATEPIYVEPDLLDSRAPGAPATAHLLSPFDNVIIQRRFGQRLFGFDYQLECYLPENKRRFGYFCLPLLYRDLFVGRADCKAHRTDGVLEIRRLHVENAEPLKQDGDRALAALTAAFARLAEQNLCGEVKLGEVQPARWRAPLRKALGRA